MGKKKRRASTRETVPEWKWKIDHFHRRYFEGFHALVEAAIPWLVLLLLFLILGELAGPINTYIVGGLFGYQWHWLEAVEHFMENYHVYVLWIDRVIIFFFVVDLYFNFFKKATALSFVKSYFLDILAVTPVGLFFAQAEVAAGISQTQSITHVGGEAEKIITRGAVEAERLAARGTKLTRTLRVFTRLPRLLRLHRLKHLFKKGGKHA